MVRPHAPRRPEPAQAVGHGGRSPRSLSGRPPFSLPAPHPYPYDILPPPELDLISVTLNRRDLWDALEFFRIEALLRSKGVQDLYQRVRRLKGDVVPQVKNVQQWIAWYGKGRVKLRGSASAVVRSLLWDETLRDRFIIGEGWAVLAGSHHRHLRLNLGRDVSLISDPKDRKHLSSRISEGIVDLAALARVREYSSIKLQEFLREEQTRFLYVRIDNAFAPEANIKELRRLLQDRHKAVTAPVEKPTIDPVTGEQSYPYHPRKDPPITEVRAWLKYLQCYDLRHRDGLTDDAIATKVYGNEESGGAEVKAKQAVRRFTLLIAAAEKNAWPPTNLSSSKNA